MDHMEMVEKLRQKANVSYEEAKQALEATDWDLLDAIVRLESEGKIKAEPNGSKEGGDEATDGAYRAQGAYSTKKEEPKRTEREEFRSQTHRAGQKIKEAVGKSNRINFYIIRDGREIAHMPLTLLLIILFISLITLTTLPLIIIIFVSFFFGFRYSFKGEGVSPDLNNGMQKFADKAEAFGRDILNKEQRNARASAETSEQEKDERSRDNA